MNLYLIRHAHAEDGQPDADRRLSRRGKSQVRKLAQFLRSSEAFVPEEIWHSTLRRAQETAALLATDAKLPVPLREVADLTPEDDPRRIARVVAKCDRSIAIVGHEPHLSALASLLVAGKASPVRFAMKKGATLALEGAGRDWIVRWHVSPDLLG
jgi:phosphohistidine phosphatase